MTAWKVDGVYYDRDSIRALIARAEAAEANVESWRIMWEKEQAHNEALEKALGDILATIFRDGGQRQDALGPDYDDAVEAAHAEWSALIARAEAAEANAAYWESDSLNTRAYANRLVADRNALSARLAEVEAERVKRAEAAEAAYVEQFDKREAAEAKLKATLDREAATHERHEKKLAEAEAERDEALEGERVSEALRRKAFDVSRNAIAEQDRLKDALRFIARNKYGLQAVYEETTDANRLNYLKAEYFQGLAYSYERKARAALPPTDAQEPGKQHDLRCARCGAPKSNHPYRHPFVSEWARPGGTP